ncbi:AAA family ATPase [Pseudotamlana agarivorans]|uniref:AAA family ATPase n=1 Tax=Pseudotamlana agarivorans TaxID=481183 RepID=UPI000834950D|nr:AAA family ATPase [Tamlana agarivorans]
MVAGLFLRNFKIYNGINFIPFLEKEDNKLNLFIGNNGSGKSSILEGLDSFFNDRDFIIHSGARIRDSSVAPVFLIKKSKLFTEFTGDKFEFANSLSLAIWNLDFTSLYASTPELEKFISLRENLKNNFSSDEYFLFVFSSNPNNKETVQGTIKSKIQNHITTELAIDESAFISKHNSLCGQIKDYYRFIYIPVDMSISDFLRIEENGIQSLTNKELKDDIKSTLNKTLELPGLGAQRRTTRNVAIINYINEKIQEYVEEVEAAVQTIDSSYHFNREQRTKKVNVKDFTEVIIDVYFSKRRLQKDEKDIQDLSAGERKKALIDITYAFISQEHETDHEVIIGIDEPETSLHISMCYEQYERIEEIANKFNTQLFVTTHWYGGLPVLNKGRLYHVQKSPTTNVNIEVFELANYFEERGTHPNDVNLKSFYDLTSSIISAVRSKSTNWLIVEGKTDKDYLSHYLPDNLDVKILPVGGCTIVKKIYEYLYLPIQANEEAKDLQGKIYCLIDTDRRGIKLEVNSETKNKKLCFRRIQLDHDTNSIKLVRIGDTLNTETEFEEVLNPRRFYSALEIVINNNPTVISSNNSSETVQQIFSNYAYEEESIFSFIRGTNSILKLASLNRNFNRDTESIHEFFDSKKDEICQEYLKLDPESSPLWIQDIIQFYN